MKKNLVLLVFILLIPVISGTINAEKVSDGNSADVQGSPSVGETITILDDRGQYITIPYPVQHVVFLVENAMNSMYAVGGADQISGIGSIWMADRKEPFFRAIDPGYDKKPKIKTDNTDIDLTALKQATPDLVVLWSADWNDEITTKIRNNLDVPVYGVYYTKLSDVSRANSVYARIIGKEEREAEVSDIMGEYTRKITDITADLTDSDRPTVFWMWNDMYGTAGLNSATNDLITLAGGRNVLEHAEFEGKKLEHPVISLETLRKLNPDVIYLWYNEKADPADIIEGKGDFAAWKDLKAVKNKRVYEVSDPFVFDSFSPQQPLALMAIAKNLHPELFGGMNLQENIDSFFVKMYGVHYPGLSKA
jgi:iron complex transport system substrate-binding protein